MTLVIMDRLLIVLHGSSSTSERGTDSEAITFQKAWKKAAMGCAYAGGDWPSSKSAIAADGTIDFLSGGQWSLTA